ncbi:hypothetical protein NAC44_05095 [Allorhizobium sp. BGMRC 0089]|uniref:hypothetical protein n=1 Tax=Allorhizobium sonneratiae TaxID=2934936 RepID=UPI0020336388|nr:hypothetical protein [Allorhizobium sonneratiae]MCM2291703.1 hypothetical protein [Allorhizobium sonneratiae]
MMRFLMKARLFFALIGLLCAALTQNAYAEKRPTYPWKSDYPVALPGNTSRHHMIPWDQLVQFGLSAIDTEEKAKAFLKTYSGFDAANLGTYGQGTKEEKITALSEAYIQKVPDAVETMKSLFAWMQGNLVVGPNRGTSDPGEKFDDEAFNCHQHYAAPAEAEKFEYLKQRWDKNSTKPDVFAVLSKTPMLGPDTRTDHPAPPEPACVWTLP